jgi:hypothetical protein
LLIFKRKKVGLGVETAIRNRLVLFLIFSSLTEVTSVAHSVGYLVERVVHLLDNVRLVLSAESFLYVQLMVWSRQRLIKVEPTALRNRLYLMIVRPVFIVRRRYLTLNLILTPLHRCHSIEGHLSRFLLLLRFKHRPSRFNLLPSVFVEALSSHMEVLNLKMLDPITENPVLLSKMNQFSVYVINRHAIVRSHLFFA